MPSKAELHSTFSGFPSEDHVKKICRPGRGAETCRYLVFDDEGFNCGKASFSRGVIDEESERGTMRAKGDNCDGTLGFVEENQSLLVGKKTIYEEQLPKIREEATLKGLETGNGMVTVKTSKENYLCLSEGRAQIDISPKGLVFSARGCGILAGELQILFEDT